MQSQKDFPSGLEHEAKEADLSTNQSKKIRSIWATTIKGTSVFETMIGLRPIRSVTAEQYLKMKHEKDVGAIKIFVKQMLEIRDHYKDAVNYLIRSMVVEQDSERAGIWFFRFFR
jgi:hypothetical protein